MTYAEAKMIAQSLDSKVKEASHKLNTYPTGQFGLTPDSIKFSPEYKADYALYYRAFQELRDFNKGFVKNFKTAIAAERSARNQQRMA